MLKTKAELRERIYDLEAILKDTLWLARRYANGRQTAVPDMFRRHYNFLKKWMPELLPKHDDTIDDHARQYMNENSQPTDWLIDCND